VFGKKEGQWLIEHFTSYQLFFWAESIVLRNPLLHQEPKVIHNIKDTQT